MNNRFQTLRNKFSWVIPSLHLDLLPLIQLSSILTLSQIIYKMCLNRIKTCCANTIKGIAGMEMGFKMLLISTITLQILFQFKPLGEINIINYIPLVVEEHEYWRLFSSSLSVGGLYWTNILYTLFIFYFMHLSMREIESKYSTLYVLIQIIKQTFIINLIVTALLYPFIFLNYLPRETGTRGLLVPVINFVWQVGTRCGQSPINVFFLPFPIKKKYIPWFFMIILLAIFGISLVTFMVIFTLTMTQHFCLPRPFFSLPTKFYLLVNRCVPNFIKNMKGYIDVDAVRDKLDQVCQNWGLSTEIHIQKNDIGSTQFKKYWEEKEVNKSEFFQQKQVVIEQQPDKLMDSNIHSQDAVYEQQRSQKQKGYAQNWRQMQVVSHENQILTQNNKTKKPQEQVQQQEVKREKSYKQHWSSIANQTQNLQKEKSTEFTVQKKQRQDFQRENRKQFSEAILIQTISQGTRQYQDDPQPKSPQQLQVDHPTYNAGKKKSNSKIVQAQDQQQEWY